MLPLSSGTVQEIILSKRKAWTVLNGHLAHLMNTTYNPNPEENQPLSLENAKIQAEIVLVTEVTNGAFPGGPEDSSKRIH